MFPTMAKRHMDIELIVENPIRPAEILLRDKFGRRKLLQFQNASQIIDSIRKGALTSNDCILRVIDDGHVVYSRLEANGRFCSITDLMDYFR